MAVRPARLALLIPDVEDWVHFAHRAMEFLSRTWGGAGHILVPCQPDGEVPEEFWRLLDAYDADYYGLYIPTPRDRQLADPKGFARRSKKQARQMEEQGFHDPKGFLASDIFLDEALSTWSPASSVTTRIRRSLSPIHQTDELHYLHIQANQGHGWDLTDMTALPVPETDEFVSFDTSEFDPFLSLMLLGVTGSLSSGYKTHLEEHDHRVVSHRVTEAQLDPMLEICLHGHADPKQRETERKLAEELGQESPAEPPWSGPEIAEQFPLSKTKLACEWRHRFSPRWMHQPYILVVGDTLSDFCLGMMLSRMTGAAAWVPARLLNDNGVLADKMRRTLARELRFNLCRNQGEDVPVITSVSLDHKDLEDLVHDLTRKLYGSGSNSAPLARVVQVDKIPMPPPLRLLHSDLCNLPGYSPFVSTDMQVAVDTPIPRDCTGETAVGVTWWVDLSFSNHLLPTRSCLNGIIVAEGYRGHRAVRCSKMGITYFSHSMFTWGGAKPHEAVERPRVRCPEAKEVFDRLLAQDGLTATLSSAGQFTFATLNLFGGLQEFVHALLEKSENEVLNMFLCKENSSEETGVFLNSVHRRFLPFGVIKNTARLENAPTRKLIDGWVDRGILARGLVLQCPRCSNSGWYAIEEVGVVFRCNRCRQNSPMSQRAWKWPIQEPVWYYELAEVVYQALSQNARAPVLALAGLQNDSKAFLFTPELIVQSTDGLRTEIDLWAVADGEIVLGEANTTGELDQSAGKEKRKLQRLRRVADAVTADQILFATTAGDWDAKSRDRITDAFKDSRA